MTLFLSIGFKKANVNSESDFNENDEIKRRNRRVKIQGEEINTSIPNTFIFIF